MRLRPLYSNPPSTTVPSLGMSMTKCDTYPQHFDDDTGSGARMMQFVTDPTAPFTMSSNGNQHDHNVVECTTTKTSDKYIKVQNIVLQETLPLVS